MTVSSFDTLRLSAVVFTVLLRFVLMPIYLQAYLNLAHSRIEDQKAEAGRITNQEMQKKITSIFYYLCVVTLQYAAPIIMCMFLACMYKTLGGFSWVPTMHATSAASTVAECLEECAAEPEKLTAIVQDVFESDVSNVNEDANILQVAESFQLSLQNLKSVFTQDVFRGLFGFATWWTCFMWFTSTSLGMVYQSYFINKT